jgi:Protein of unknown function (DUF1320)
MALRPFPLTSARFKASASRKAGADDPFSGVDASVIEQWCEWASDTVQSAMADRIEAPLLQWDAALEGVAIGLAAFQIMIVRGFDKNKGADMMIVDRNRVCEAYLERLRDKSENPTFVDSSSTGIGTRDSIAIVSSGRVEYWRKNGACGGCR